MNSSPWQWQSGPTPLHLVKRARSSVPSDSPPQTARGLGASGAPQLTASLCLSKGG